MKLLVVPVVLLALTGCNRPGEVNKYYPFSTPTYNISYSVEGANFLNADDMDSLYEKTAECLGVWEETPAFVVTFKQHNKMGEYWYDDHSIVVNSDLSDRLVVNTYRHEVIHYLLHVFTGDPDTEHTSEYWNRTGYPYCEGMLGGNHA